LEKSNAHILMKTKKIFKIILLILLTIFLTFVVLNFKIMQTKILVIYNEEQNTEDFLIISDSKFKLSYIHSVHHTPVYELFEINQENKIILNETRFSSLGVGMPTTDEGGTLINNNGEFVLKFSREFDNIYIRVSSIPQHAIEVGDKKYPLLEFAESEQRLKIYAKDKWMLLRK